MASAAEYKKGELVTKLSKFFGDAKSAMVSTETDRKANLWLPEAMAFPAINPDAKDKSEEDFEESGDFEDEEEYAEAA